MIKKFGRNRENRKDLSLTRISINYLYRFKKLFISLKRKMPITTANKINRIIVSEQEKLMKICNNFAKDSQNHKI